MHIFHHILNSENLSAIAKLATDTYSVRFFHSIRKSAAASCTKSIMRLIRAFGGLENVGKTCRRLTSFYEFTESVHVSLVSSRGKRRMARRKKTYLLHSVIARPQNNSYWSHKILYTSELEN